VTIRTGTRFSADSIRTGSYDVAIVATGSTEARLTLADSSGVRIVQARAVLEHRADVRGRVVVAGAGCAGAQTAEYLADLGHPVTVVEATTNVAADAPMDDRALLLGRLAGHGVEILTDTRLLGARAGRVRVQSVGKSRTLPADTLVVCVGAVSNAELADQLARRVARIIVVGDAKEPRRINDAIREGALAALSV
jgi:pyruvate/2-oxoglutarate dehydrogenase complex dihydrolipoamide dehydrogenase (E3) component